MGACVCVHVLLLSVWSWEVSWTMTWFRRVLSEAREGMRPGNTDAKEEASGRRVSRHTVLRPACAQAKKNI